MKGVYLGYLYMCLTFVDESGKRLQIPEKAVFEGIWGQLGYCGYKKLINCYTTSTCIFEYSIAYLIIV